MKKSTLLLLCATLSCSLAFAQGAEIEDDSNRLLFIPRVEFNPYAVPGDGRYNGGNDFGNTSLYTLFEGGIGESAFSYSIEGHWLSTDPASLYRNVFRSQESTFIDWAYLSCTLGSFEISAGKLPLAIGTHEEDAYDFDMHYNLCSTLWNDLQIYQYGLSAAWTAPDETTTLTAQFTSSPFGDHPFAPSKEDRSPVSSIPPLFAYSLKWTGEYGCFTPIWSYNLLDTYRYGTDPETGESYEDGRGKRIHVFALGNKFSFGDFEAVLDYTTRWCGGESVFGSEASAIGSLAYSPGDKFRFTLKGGYEFCRVGEDHFGYLPEDGEEFSTFVPTSLALMNELDGHGFVFGGALVEWTPLDDLRVHACVSANNWAKCTSFNFGVTYYFDLLKHIRK